MMIPRIATAIKTERYRPLEERKVCQNQLWIL